MDLSIIIVNWNSKDYLEKCIDSIVTTTHGVKYEIIVIDNASYDGCDEMLRIRFPQVKFIQSDKNLGFAKANNLGFEISSGQNLLFLNPDTEMQGNAIQALYYQLESLPKAGIVGARLLNPDGSLQTSCVRAFPTPLNKAVDSEFLRKLLPKSRLWGTWKAFIATVPCNVDAVSGACMLLKSDVFRKVGGFSPEYFMYAEDMDLCFKVTQLGFKIYYVPNAVIVHYGGGSSTKQPNTFSIITMREANYAYMLKNHGPYKARLYYIFQGASALIRLGIMLPFILFSKFFQNKSIQYSFQKWKIILRWALKKGFQG